MPLLWGVVPASKLDVDTPAIGAARPSLEAALLDSLTRDNPWLTALGHLGLPSAFDTTRVPVEEGETSLNLNTHQALASLMACGTVSPPPAVLGNLVFGNHGLLFYLDGLADSLPASRRALPSLIEPFFALGPSALAAACLASPAMAKTRGDFARRPFILDRRILRFPATLFTMPRGDALRRFLAALGLAEPTARRLLDVRDAMDAAGLSTVADYQLVARAVLLRDLAALAGADARGHLPLSFESLLARTTGDLMKQPLAKWVADYHQRLAAHLAGRQTNIAARGHGTFRVLSYFNPMRLLSESDKRLSGRGSELGWETLRADFLSGRIASDPVGLACRPVGKLLDEGFGLSGKLVYHAVCRINDSRVRNLIVRSASDVFASLADIDRPNLVLPVRSIRVVGAWQETPITLDLMVFTDWLSRAPDPARSARLIFDAYQRLACKLEAPRARIVLGAPGTFQIEDPIEA